MPLDFDGDAICLSGEMGTKLKSQIISRYYPFWWEIVSGGPSKNHRHSTAIIEMDAATGEVKIEDTGELILGSAGCALKLKCDNLHTTRNLRLFLIEKNEECYNKLQNIIRKRWPIIPADIARSIKSQEEFKIYLLNTDIDEALSEIEKYKYSFGLYYFDPLRSVNWEIIEKVAQQRIKSTFKTGTEFIIFLFTSDWFLGRGKFKALPTVNEKEKWTGKELSTVIEADNLFGGDSWRENILKKGEREDKQKKFLELYKRRLLKWFRYVLLLPFAPKEGQLYHLIFCSNYEAGVKVTKDFYYSLTQNIRYRPDNRKAYNKFKAKHKGYCIRYKGSRRPPEWRFLWKCIKQHEGGICDHKCESFKDEKENRKTLTVLKNIERIGYLKRLEGVEWGWEKKEEIPRFELNWEKVKRELGVEKSKELIPIKSEEDLKKAQKQRKERIMEKERKPELEKKVSGKKEEIIKNRKTLDYYFKKR